MILIQVSMIGGVRKSEASGTDEPHADSLGA